MSAASLSVPLRALPLVAFKCPTARICVLWPLQPYQLCHFVSWLGAFKAMCKYGGIVLGCSLTSHLYSNGLRDWGFLLLQRFILYFPGLGQCVLWCRCFGGGCYSQLHGGGDVLFRNTMICVLRPLNVKAYAEMIPKFQAAPACLWSSPPELK
jgi:hypothetical protein